MSQTTSKPFYFSKIFWLSVFSFLLLGLPVLTQGSYTDWREIVSTVIIPLITLILRTFFSGEKLTLK
jgi:hypothetical protein